MPDFPIAYAPGFTQMVGTNTVAPTPANTKSTYVELVASTAFEADGLIVNFTTSSTVSFLIDIAVGAAGSEQIIAVNILIAGAANIAQAVQLPLSVPAGSRLAFRAQSSDGASTIRTNLTLVRGGFWRDASAHRIETIGAVTADSGGTELDAGAVASTYPGWTQLTAATSADIAALMFIVGNAANGTTTVATVIVQLAVGGAGSEQVLVDGLRVVQGAAGNYGPFPNFWLPAGIPAGSRLAARCQMSTTDATDRKMDIVVYGLVV